MIQRCIPIPYPFHYCVYYSTQNIRWYGRDIHTSDVTPEPKGKDRFLTYFLDKKKVSHYLDFIIFPYIFFCSKTYYSWLIFGVISSSTLFHKGFTAIHVYMRAPHLPEEGIRLLHEKRLFACSTTEKRSLNYLSLVVIRLFMFSAITCHHRHWSCP